MIDWGQVAVTGLTVTGPVLLYMWKNRTQARKEAQKKHEDNQKVQNELVNLMRFHPPHTHAERSGPLHAENISFPPPAKD